MVVWEADSAGVRSHSLDRVLWGGLAVEAQQTVYVGGSNVVLGTVFETRGFTLCLE